MLALDCDVAVTNGTSIHFTLGLLSDSSNTECITINGYVCEYYGCPGCYLSYPLPVGHIYQAYSHNDTIDLT